MAYASGVFQLQPPPDFNMISPFSSQSSFLLRNNRTSRCNISFKNHCRFFLSKPAYCAPAHIGARSFNEGFPVRCTNDDIPEYLDPDKASEIDPEEEKAARIENWKERDWAPWEAALSPEAEFAIYSLQEPEGVPLRNPKSLRAFEKLSRSKEIEENKDYAIFPEQRVIKDENGQDVYLLPRTNQWGDAEPLESVWNSPVVFTMVPPRDWPPPGWKVDPEELAFIRGALPILDYRVEPDDLENAERDGFEPSFPRYNMFLKQYEEWVSANKERLERESLEDDPDYYPGRRRTGENYEAGMYELPFVYPGQIYQGYVTAVHLYEGAFVFFGCVHDGWVPIKGNDWFWIRQHVKVGMYVLVEVVAKRDPYRFRFPIELRLVDPNIDHLIFKRFEYPPIFQRDDTNYDELARETQRPYQPRKRPAKKPQEQKLERDHPYTIKIWQIHVSEQALLDEEERNKEDADIDETESEEEEEEEEEEEYSDETELKLEEGKEHIEVIGDLDPDDKVYDSDEDGYWTWGQLDGVKLPRLVLTTDEKDLDLDAAREEREMFNILEKEAKAQGRTYTKPKTRREKQMEELDEMHKRRSLEQREALLRDIACRLELGLPVEEPGRYTDRILSTTDYDPTDKRFRPDYLKGSKEHNEYLRRRKSRFGEAYGSFSNDAFDNYGDDKRSTIQANWNIDQQENSQDEED